MTKTQLLAMSRRMAYLYRKTRLMRFAKGYFWVASRLMKVDPTLKPEHLPLL